MAAESGKKSAKCACIEEGSRIVPKSVSEALGRYHKCQMPVQSCSTSRKAEARLVTESGVINAAGRSTDLWLEVDRRLCGGAQGLDAGLRLIPTLISRFFHFIYSLVCSFDIKGNHRMADSGVETAKRKSSGTKQSGQKGKKQASEDGRLLLLSGPPGAGKSTVAKELIEISPNRTVYIEGDMFWQFIAKRGENPLPRQANSRLVIKSMMLAALPFIRGGYFVILDFTIGPWHLNLIPEPLKTVAFDYVILGPSQKICAKREGMKKDGGVGDYGATYHDLYEAFCNLGDYERYAIRDDEADAKTFAQRIWEVVISGSHRLDVSKLGSD